MSYNHFSSSISWKFILECNEWKAVENKRIQSNFIPSIGNRTENCSYYFQPALNLYSPQPKTSWKSKSQVIIKQNSQFLQLYNIWEVHIYLSVSGCMLTRTKTGVDSNFWTNLYIHVHVHVHISGVLVSMRI